LFEGVSMPHYFRTIPGLDQGWTLCPNLDVALYQVLWVSESVTLLFYLQTHYEFVLLCLFLSICIVQTVCVCTLWTSCLLQNLKIKKLINSPRNSFVFTIYLKSGGV